MSGRSKRLHARGWGELDISRQALLLIFGPICDGSGAAVRWPGFLRCSHVGIGVFFGYARLLSKDTFDLLNGRAEPVFPGIRHERFSAMVVIPLLGWPSWPPSANHKGCPYGTINLSQFP